MTEGKEPSQNVQGIGFGKSSLPDKFDLADGLDGSVPKRELSCTSSLKVRT